MPLPSISPSAAAIDAAGLLALVDALEAHPGIEMHSFAIARAGRVVAEGYWAPYAAERPHLLYSVSKSWTATAVGVLVDEGRLALSDPVCRDLPGVDFAALPARWQQVTVGDCLRMATGHDQEAWLWGSDESGVATRPLLDSGLDPMVARILAHEPEHEPGTHFAYNQVATYLVAAAARAVAGTSLVGILRERVLEPLGVPELLWKTTGSGAELGFSGSFARTRDVLALAQLYLDEGRVGDRQVLSPEWVECARTPSGLVNPDPGGPDWAQGYGCSFWSSRHGYRGDGAFGQFAIVLPQHRIAVATTAETGDMQAILDAIWTHLLPAVDRAVDRPGDPAADTAADTALAERLAGLRIAPPPPLPFAGGQWSRTSGDVAQSYSAARVRPVEPGGGWELTLTRDGTDLTLAVGAGAWAESEWRADGIRLPLVAAGGGTGDGGFAAQIRLVETPHTVHLRATPAPPGGAGGFDLSWSLPPLHGPDPLRQSARYA
ncbi:conserved hypothetical protein [Nostocoides australiense Ben110]|uniref:Beta-lactamase-related domain-containing protein n=1 Tax=Nostocoides australiense Ben110 TaxID=1193182 RepID=W6K0N3_9MICO|nr:serine hydrolase [Tetrasphaera australiensis]CCH71859.1 conserved hypothetical protein [Tetrasphaera australiensis Ben110]